jgi:hypothetical protein
MKRMRCVFISPALSNFVVLNALHTMQSDGF